MSGYRLLACATSHPDPVNPYTGLFNYRAFTALSQLDVELDVIAPRPFAPPVGPYSEYGQIPSVDHTAPYVVRYPRFPYLLPKRLFHGWSGWLYSKTVPRYLEKELPEPDVLHAGHIYLDGYGVLPYRRTHDLPMTAVAHGWAINNYHDHRRSIRRKIDAVLDECDRMICVSEALLERVRDISPQTPVSLVPLGADPDRFPTENAATVKREMGISPEEVVVLFCGQFIERKGVPLLVDAIREGDYDQTQFILVGHGGDRKRVVSDLASMRDDVRVFEGMGNEELAKWFAAADLFVLPSYSEGRPTVLYEAMASETAVLATTVGGVPEQVEDETTGVLIPSGDGDALRRKMEALTADRRRLREMGRDGYRRLVREGWTWEDHASRLYDIHARLVK